jgi:glutathione synthase/RimK-type ligase-like ATP-grasp enzyme
VAKNGGEVFLSFGGRAWFWPSLLEQPGFSPEGNCQSGGQQAKTAGIVRLRLRIALRDSGILAPDDNEENFVKTIGILFGMENTFPPAVVEKINSMKVDGVTAEFVKIGGIRMDEPKKYAVIIDRISQDIQFYRAWLKNAALHGSIVVNNPFWWTADDKFFNYALAHKLGVAIPPTVILPHNRHPEGTTDQSMRNLIYPLNWQELFDCVGFPAFLKPYSGGGWKHVYKVHSPEEFFHHYNQTGDLCMTLQRGVEFEEYYRCYVVGQEKVHIMKYDPKAPHHERYVKGNPPPSSPALRDRMEKDALTLCRALGYDLNTVEFAVERGVPYAIDFLNPAPDADVNSVGKDNFDWIVNAVAEMAVKMAAGNDSPLLEMRWAPFLAGDLGKTPQPSGKPRQTKSISNA